MTAAEGAGRPILRQRVDGRLDAEAAAPSPIMAPRLQGEVDPEGWADLALWGAGELGRVRFTPLAGPYVYAPNQVTAAGGGVWVAQTAPVMVVRGARITGVFPARRSATWDRRARPAQNVTRSGSIQCVELAWGSLTAEQRGADLVIAAGATTDEADRARALDVEEIVRESQANARRCDRMAGADPLLRGMVLHGVHAALSSIRADAEGGFAGLAAGLAYSAPARTYYRDGYWTAQALLMLAPDAVRGQIDILARGIRGDGEAPSGVIVTGPAQSAAWVRLLRDHPRAADVNRRPEEWWSDHFDSPLFFILLLADYARTTGDDRPVRSYWPQVRAIVERYARLADGRGLPLKPRHDRDWADNVYREGAVAYDLGLWIGALDAVVVLGARLDPPLAAKAVELAAQARGAMEKALVTPGGWFADYATPAGFVEDHLSLDSLTLLRCDAVPLARAAAVLDAVQARLESRRNRVQPWGDWGMLCTFPPFKRRADTRAKSAFAFRYHNGADWPWLDGLYAGERLRRGLDGWRYPLTRWWETSLANGWAGAVEYFSPPFGRGSLLQGWSSLPAAIALAHADAVLAGDPAEASSATA
jgi:hypothetical protein